MVQQAVSLVLPAFNEEARLRQSLPLLVDWVAASGTTVEILVIDDGSTDDTVGVARAGLASLPGARVLRLPWNMGKGAAVRFGVAAAHGHAVVYMDADLSADLVDLPHLLDALDGADVAVGSRSAAGAVVDGRSLLRSTASKGFSGFVTLATGLGLHDTQCGFKAFRAPVAKLLFQLAVVDGFAFDVEVLMIADKLGYRIVEVPVRWQEVGQSQVRLFHHVPEMLIDVLRTSIRVKRRFAAAQARRQAMGAPAAKAATAPVPAVAYDAPFPVVDATDVTLYRYPATPAAL